MAAPRSTAKKTAAKKTAAKKTAAKKTAVPPVEEPQTEQVQLMLCVLCWSVTPDLPRHRRFHQVYQQHSAECAVTRVRMAQGMTGAYILPQPCDCGLFDDASTLFEETPQTDGE
jgi:Pyruvate/2-oxoacid:ferredoxin oxidoreductase delta subunit